MPDTSDDLPGDDPLRCAPATLELGVDPIGSAIRVDRLVVVEVPPPWPADIGDIGWIGAIPTSPGCRIQAVVPEAARADGTTLVTCWERDGARFVGTDWLVPVAGVPAAVAAACAGEVVDDADPTPAPHEVLVCGHGSRDRCCGGSGTRVALEATAALPDIRIRRTSHLGGHRFAPTALVLPDGRQWAHLDGAAIVGIVERTLRPLDARDHYRGNVALDAWAQVVEGEALVASGWDVFEATTIDADVGVDGDVATVTLRWDGPCGAGSRTGTVGIRRHYPVLACGLPASEATKSAAEYELLD